MEGKETKDGIEDSGENYYNSEIADNSNFSGEVPESIKYNDDLTNNYYGNEILDNQPKYQSSYFYEKPISPSLSINQNYSESNYSGPLTIGSKELKKKTKIRVCSNCQTMDTPSWRRGVNGKILLCNACGLYQKLHNRSRPYSINSEGKTKAMKSIFNKIRCVACNNAYPFTLIRSLSSGNMCEECYEYFKANVERPTSSKSMTCSPDTERMSNDQNKGMNFSGYTVGPYTTSGYQRDYYQAHHDYDQRTGRLYEYDKGIDELGDNDFTYSNGNKYTPVEDNNFRSYPVLQPQYDNLYKYGNYPTFYSSREDEYRSKPNSKDNLGKMNFSTVQDRDFTYSYNPEDKSSEKGN